MFEIIFYDTGKFRREAQYLIKPKLRNLKTLTALVERLFVNAFFYSETQVRNHLSLTDAHYNFPHGYNHYYTLTTVSHTTDLYKQVR